MTPITEPGKEERKDMKMLLKMGTAVVCSAIALTGCATNSSVQVEIAKAKSEITSQYTKAIDDSYSKVTSDMNKKLTDFQKDFALKNYVDGRDYELKQELMKEVVAQVENAKKLSGDLQATLDTMKLSGEAGLDNLAKYLRASANVITKQLQAQRESIELAIEELNKLELGKESGSAPPPEAPK